MTMRQDAGASPTVLGLIRHPSAFLPLAMSLGALAMVAWFVALHGTVRQPDESAQARLWLLLVAGQVPVIALFAYGWLQRATRPALVILALQAAAIALLGIAPLWALGGL